MESVMANVIKIILLSAIAIGVLNGQRTIIQNQKIQMKQQFHNDFIALVSLLDEDGLEKVATAKNTSSLTMKESFATGLLLQRFIKAYEIRNAFSDEEWNYIEKEIKVTIMGSQLLRARWEQVRIWYSPGIRYPLDKIIFDNLTEK